jgi:hypothetical protein
MNREQLIAAMRAAAPKPVAVSVPSLGGTILVRALTIAQVDRMGEPPEGLKDLRIARGLAASIVDEDGNLIFNPDDVDDVKLVASQEVDLMTAISTALKPQGAGEPGNGSAPAKS